MNPNLADLARRTAQATKRARTLADAHPTRENWDVWHLLIEAQVRLENAARITGAVTPALATKGPGGVLVRPDNRRPSATASRRQK